MKSETFRTFKRIILVSTPWPLFSRPSIQLGALKAYIARRHPDIDVDARHFYLKVAASLGYPVYSGLSERSWTAETVYAALLYPERSEDVEKIFVKETAGSQKLRKTDFRECVETVRAVTDDFIEVVPWETYGLAGFSICLCQLTSTLYVVRAVRKKAPNLPIVIGGSAVPGDGSGDFLRAFPDIDFVVCGEGEIPLDRLIGKLKKGAHPPRSTSPGVPDILGREDSLTDKPSLGAQIDDLDALPFPDYAAYFDLLKSLGSANTFFPFLPMEMSRGCRWKRSVIGNKPSGCAFCNLNRQWKGYRTKTPQRVAAEIDSLSSDHQTLSVTFTDNLLPEKNGKPIFDAIRHLNKDFRLFGEIRAHTPISNLEAMKAAGMSEVQIGIEALSTRLLKKINKGSTAIRNIEIMKVCEELGLVSASNLILCFPGSDMEDVAETLNNLSFVVSFRPLRIVNFWLGLGSPVWQEPDKFGIKAVFNHRYYAHLFPPDIARRVAFPIQAYRGDRKRQHRIWMPVKQKVREWEKTYDSLHSGTDRDPILSYRDGGDFMIIRQRRLGVDPMTHRLVGPSRSIYRFCRRTRSLKQIGRRFPDVGMDKIRPFLKMMVGKKLMFTEGNRYLSLAVKARRI